MALDSIGRHLLIGIVVDLSASMKKNAQNEADGQLSRLQVLWSSLEQVRNNIKNHFHDKPDELESSLEFFVYGFGFRNISVACDMLALLTEQMTDSEVLSYEQVYNELEKEAQEIHWVIRALLKGSAKRAIRDNPKAASKLVTQLKDPLIRQQLSKLATEIKGKNTSKIEAYLTKLAIFPSGETTLPWHDAVRLLSDQNKIFEKPDNLVEGLFYGDKSSMTTALLQAKERFKRELAKRPENVNALLFVFSDGQLLDSDPQPVIEDTKALGITIISCFFASENAVNPRILYNKPPQRGIKRFLIAISNFNLMDRISFAKHYVYDDLSDFFPKIIKTFTSWLGPVVDVFLSFMAWLMELSNWWQQLVNRFNNNLLTRSTIRMANVLFRVLTLNYLISGLFVVLVMWFGLFVVALVFVIVTISTLFRIFAIMIYRLVSNQYRPGNGIEIMFKIASELPQDSPLSKFLIEKGWKIEPNAKLFFQINHASVLGEIAKFLEYLVRTRITDTERGI